jgi:hypothetical protein
MIILTYLSYRIRKKIFDYFILIINIFLYILPIFNWTKYNFCGDEENKSCDKNEMYSLPYVLGQFFSEKYTHYFINFYYFGFIIGVMLFYYNENIFYKLNYINLLNKSSSNSSRNSQDKNFKAKSNMKNNNTPNNILNILPFSFCNDIIMFLSKIKFWKKRTLLLICFSFIILISNSFYFIQFLFNENNEEYKIDLPFVNNPIAKYIFLYEKNLCCIFFFILLMIFIVYPNDKNIIKFSNLNFFNIFDRINFSFFCSYSYFVYAAFCVFHVDLKINYINIFLNSLGFFMIIIIINVFIVCIFELPVRMLIKSFMNRTVEEDFRLSIYFAK